MALRVRSWISFLNTSFAQDIKIAEIMKNLLLTCDLISSIASVGMMLLLDNLRLSCVNTAREVGAEKAPCCDTVAAAGADAARLTCSTVGTSVRLHGRVDRLLGV